MSWASVVVLNKSFLLCIPAHHTLRVYPIVADFWVINGGCLQVVSPRWMGFWRFMRFAALSSVVGWLLLYWSSFFSHVSPQEDWQNRIASSTYAGDTHLVSSWFEPTWEVFSSRNVIQLSFHCNTWRILTKWVIKKPNKNHPLFMPFVGLGWGGWASSLSTWCRCPKGCNNGVRAWGKLQNRSFNGEEDDEPSIFWTYSDHVRGSWLNSQRVERGRYIRTIGTSTKWWQEVLQSQFRNYMSYSELYDVTYVYIYIHIYIYIHTHHTAICPKLRASRKKKKPLSSVPIRWSVGSRTKNPGVGRKSHGIWFTGWWFGTWILFSQKYWVAVIIPIDELIFFRGVAQPPTSLDIADENGWLVWDINLPFMSWGGLLYSLRSDESKPCFWWLSTWICFWFVDIAQWWKSTLLVPLKSQRIWRPG